MLTYLRENHRLTRGLAVRVRTLPRGKQALLEQVESPQYKNVAICILIVACEERAFADLVQLVNNEIDGYIASRKVAEHCYKLHARGLIRISE